MIEPAPLSVIVPALRVTQVCALISRVPSVTVTVAGSTPLTPSRSVPALIVVVPA